MAAILYLQEHGIPVVYDYCHFQNIMQKHECIDKIFYRLYMDTTFHEENSIRIIEKNDTIVDTNVPHNFKKIYVNEVSYN